MAFDRFPPLQNSTHIHTPSPEEIEGGSSSRAEESWTILGRRGCAFRCWPSIKPTRHNRQPYRDSILPENEARVLYEETGKEESGSS